MKVHHQLRLRRAVRWPWVVGAVFAPLVSACDGRTTTLAHPRECPRGTVAIDAGTYAGGSPVGGGFLQVADPQGVAAYREETLPSAFQCAYVCVPKTHPVYTGDHLVCMLDTEPGGAR